MCTQIDNMTGSKHDGKYVKNAKITARMGMLQETLNGKTVRKRRRRSNNNM